MTDIVSRFLAHPLESGGQIGKTLNGHAEELKFSNIPPLPSSLPLELIITSGKGVKEKKSFILHCDKLAVLDHLTDAQAGQLFKAIKAYQNNKKIELDQIIQIAFTPFENQFRHDNAKYQSICERNRANGMKGGRPKEPKKPSGLNGNPKNLDTDTDTDTKKKRRFAPPSLKEINFLIEEKHYIVDGERFFNHYESNGWMVGKNKMKSWQHALANWNRTTLHENPRKSKIDAFNAWIDEEEENVIN